MHNTSNILPGGTAGQRPIRPHGRALCTRPRIGHALVAELYSIPAINIGPPRQRGKP